MVGEPLEDTVYALLIPWHPDFSPLSPHVIKYARSMSE